MRKTNIAFKNPHPLRLIPRLRALAICIVATSLSTIATGSTASTNTSEYDPAGAFELYFELTSSIRTVKLDADLWAGGKLLMRGRRQTDGTLTLTYVRAIESPWKFYWIDRLGPGGDEVKLASVVTLNEASWEALKTARDRNAAFGAEIHQKWEALTGKHRELDGTFVFVVIGDAEGRFDVTIRPSGELTRIHNRLTDRWLTGPFDRWIGTWGFPRTSDKSPQGYWFWNHGETLPFSYEPHTYHGLAAALKLLMQPLPRLLDDSTTETAMDWENPLHLAHSVLKTLGPRLHRPTPEPTSVSVTIELVEQ
ncbi:MAG: hypothetical protein V3S30_05035, partial [Thermoanaerobaculia bacterium]